MGLQEISEEDMYEISVLSKLSLSREEMARARSGLQKMLEYMAKIQEITVADEALASERLFDVSELREDEATETNQKTELLRNAPKVRDGMLQVPNTLQQE